MRDKDTQEIYRLIASNIRRYRLAKHYSQDSLAYESGVNRAYIGYIERGERNPSIAILHKIARTLDVPIYEFLMTDAQASQLLVTQRR